MFKPYAQPDPEPIGFLLVPGFSMMAFFSAIEPLRVANRLAGRKLFTWHAYSLDGHPVASSNDMKISAEAAIGSIAFVPTLIVCSGFEPWRAETRLLHPILRRLARKGGTLGALDTGTHILASAGLLEDVRVTMHWEAVPAFREEFPWIEVTGELFEIADARFTCAGGTAALDMMLHMVALEHGQPLAVAISEQFIHDRIRDRTSRQRMQITNRIGVSNRKLVRIIEAMERHLEDPLGGEDLARLSNVSARQLERLFRAHLGDTPSGYYLKLRVERARHLLRQTEMSVMEVSVATGFSSASCLSRAYRQRYRRSPRQDRHEPLFALPAVAAVAAMPA